jgi:hypothetical protein
MTTGGDDPCNAEENSKTASSDAAPTVQPASAADPEFPVKRSGKIQTKHDSTGKKFKFEMIESIDPVTKRKIFLTVQLV